MSGTKPSVARPRLTRGAAGRGSTARVNRRKPNYALIGLWIALVIGALAWLVPFAVMFLTSVKSNAEISQLPLLAAPKEWKWNNFSSAIETGNLWRTGLNSLIISVVKVPLGLFLAACAAYALARLRLPFSRTMWVVFAVGSMVPIQVGLGPLFKMMQRIGLLDNIWGLVLPYFAFGIPYQIFVLYGFFRSIPNELEESAKLDGAGTFRIFLQIVLPLSKASLAALFILDFVATWNEYAIAATLLQSQSNWTVPLAVLSFSAQHGTDYGPMNAFIMMSAIPVLIVYLLFQKYFVSGALAGAVKG